MLNRRHFLSLSAGMAVATATASLPALAQDRARSGRFKGKSRHVTTGHAELSGSRVVLQRDFTFDGAPDARIGLGRNGRYDPYTDLGALKKLKGQQSYRLRGGIDVSKYNEVYVWCRKFNVPLGVAKLGG
ncbi:DM13 domain-containing protein [uncultured Roseibium sp.]|uniref:DM13 domain-containing protein n=1 Tax=uncultured Roseibium sp. TaxID=1936171 RepID=UPI00263767CC|nr:DM13 domain-containing protein [uncultured Roseibium sp.]